MRDTIRLFEIPVYGLSEQALKNQVDTEKDELEKNCQAHDMPNDHQRDFIRCQMYPMGNWEYNHIVGFIKNPLTGKT